MVKLELDKASRQIILRTDDPSAYLLLEKEEKITEFIPWQRKWGTVTKKTKIYTDRGTPKCTGGIYTYHINYGFAAYIVNVFKNFIGQDDFDMILREVIYSPYYRTIPFPELRDYQNEDVLHVLKYRLGLFSVYTSYGKNLPHYLCNENQVKTVKGVIPNTVLNSIIAKGILSV